MDGINKMKILVVVPDTNVGGVTSSAINFSNELVKRGHSVDFLDMDGIFSVDGLYKKVNRIKLPKLSIYWNITKNRDKGLSSIKHKVFGLAKKMFLRLGLWYKFIFFGATIKKEYDVSIAFKQCLPCYYFVLRKTRAQKKIAFVHGELKFMNNYHSWSKQLNKFSKIACVSKSIKNEFVIKFPRIKSKFCTVYNMFDVEKINELSKQQPPFTIDNSFVNIVTVSRLDNDFKRIDWIIRICGNLKSLSKIKFHWYVVGDGPDKENLIKMSRELKTEDVLTFTGNFKNPFSILSRCNFSVLLSKSEGYPMFALESIILKKPILVTNFGSSSEIIEKKKNGIILPGNEEEIAVCIRDFITDKDNIYSNCNEYLKSFKYSNDQQYYQFLESIK